MSTDPESQPHVVVLGAGFAGLEVCRRLANEPVLITLVDRTNHHLFQPLLYQVATAGLSAAEIAQPIRSILRDARNVRVVMDEVMNVDLAARRVELAEIGALAYDRLVVAVGARTNYYDHDDWEPNAPGLKTLEDALSIRRQVLATFERAEREADPVRRREAMRIIVIGGGPTGAELAGALAELSRRVLDRDFRRIDPTEAQILLLEAADRILLPFSERLSESARRQLEALGVEVRVGQEIVDVRPGAVLLPDEQLRAGTILWGAGVRAVPLAQSLGVPTDRAGRLEVEPDLSLPGAPEAYAIGDVAHVVDAEDKEVPGLAPAALQMGRHVAEALRRDLVEGRPEARPFVYEDRGSMATLGRTKAVARIKGLELTGLVAWLGWLFIHLIFLVGLRNRLFVLLQWLYSYVFYRRGARIIHGGPRAAGSAAAAPEDAREPDAA